MYVFSSFFKNQHGKLVLPACWSSSSPLVQSAACQLAWRPAQTQAGFSGTPHSPVDPVSGGKTLAVALHEVGVLLRAVKWAPICEQPVQGRLAGRGGMMLGDRSGRRGRDSQHPTGEGQCQQSCPWGCRHRPKPSKSSAALPPHASPRRLVSSFSRHTLPLCAAPPGLLELGKYNTEMSVAHPGLTAWSCEHQISLGRAHSRNPLS